MKGVIKVSVIVTYKGQTIRLRDNQKVAGTKCKKCKEEIDALSFAIGSKRCFKCLKKNTKEGI